MGLIIPLIFFLLSNGLIVYISKKSFGKCLPIDMMLMAFSYFISQFIFGTFKVGFVINILSAVMFIILIIKDKIKNNNLEELKKNYFSNGCYAFIIIFLIIFIFDYNRGFIGWDEFSHWGEMVKEMLRTDKFYSAKVSTLLVHKDYPPIIQLFELFYLKLSGGYSETFLIKGLHLLEFSFFIPAISEKVKIKSKFKLMISTILIALSVYMIFLLFDSLNRVNSIYIDYPMAIIVAYLLSLIIFEKNPLSNFNLISMCIGCSFLLLTKQIALTLYAMILFMFVGNLIIKSKFKIKISKDKLIPLLKLVALVIVVPLIVYKGWGYYISTLNVDQQFQISNIKLNELKGIVKGTSGEDWQHKAFVNYIGAIKERIMTTSYIQLSYIQSFILIALLLYLLYKSSKNFYKKEQIRLLIITLFLGLIGYAFVMLILYVFAFGSYEGPKLASFYRYIPTYILTCASITYMMFIKLVTHNKYKLNILFICFACIFILQSPNQIAKMVPKLSKAPVSIYETYANRINKKTPAKSRVFLIAQNSSGKYQYYVKYYMGARTTNLYNFSLPVTEIDNYKKYFDKNVKKYMSTFDYVYLISVDDDFADKYSFLFNNKDIKNDQLYKIEKNSKQLKLELVK